RPRRGELSAPMPAHLLAQPVGDAGRRFRDLHRLRMAPPRQVDRELPPHPARPAREQRPPDPEPPRPPALVGPRPPPPPPPPAALPVRPQTASSSSCSTSRVLASSAPKGSSTSRMSAS